MWDLYFEQGLLQKDIAHRFHKSKATISDWFKMFGITTIPTRAVKTVKKRQREQVAQLLGGDPKEVLVDLYFKQGLSTTDIVHRFHNSQPTISKWFKIFGIATSRSRRAGNTRRERYIEQLTLLLGGDPKQVLEDLYFKQGLSQKDIAIRFHKHRESVTNWFEMFGISTFRTKRAGKTVKKRQLERLTLLLGGDPKATLEDLHLKQGLSQTDIAHRFHKTPPAVRYWFKKFGVTINQSISYKANEDTKLRRSLVAKHLFQNPEYRASVFARLRSPEFQAKGRIAREKRFKENPDFFKRRGKTLKDHKLDQLKQLLGGEPKEILEYLHLKQGLSQTDIARRFHKHTTTVNHWFKRFGIIRKEAKAIQDNAVLEGHNSPH